VTLATAPTVTWRSGEDELRHAYPKTSRGARSVCGLPLRAERFNRTDHARHDGCERLLEQMAELVEATREPGVVVAPAAATKPAGVHRTRFHLYYFNGEGPWPGVTSITKVLDAPALTNWKLNQVALTAIENAERLAADREAGKVDAAVKYLTTLSTSAMDRGSRIHANIEAILRHEPTDVDPRDASAVAGARAWLNQQATEHGLRPIAIEAFLLNTTLGYGGTLDLIAEIDGEAWLLDWKTGNSVATPDGKVYRDHRLQLAAYANAEFIAREGDPTRYAVPAVTRFGIVHVTDGGTRLYEAHVTERDWIAFRACLALHGWMKEKAA
jgi:hypothetical protein